MSAVAPPGGGLGRFGDLLRTPHVGVLSVTSVLARLPFGTDALAVLLYVQDRTGSFATGGLVSACIAIADAVSVPVTGRLVDRLGQTPVLLATAALHALGIVGLLVLGAVGAPLVTLALAACVAGIFPPISPCLRGLWPSLLGGDEERVRTALAFDAIILETVFIGGPLLAAVVLALASPAAALIVVVVLATAGTLSFAASPASRRWRAEPRTGTRVHVLRVPAMRTLLGTALPIGIAMGSVEVALSAYGVAHGEKAYGAVAIACLAAGSAVGGLVYGSRIPADVRRAYLLLSAAVPLGLLLLAAAGPLFTLLLAAPVAGAVLAPLGAAESELVSRAAPAGTVTEAYGWLIMAIAGGASIGAAAAGSIVEHAGWRQALLAAAVASAGGAAVAWGRRRSFV
jgi:MFS family permease